MSRNDKFVPKTKICKIKFKGLFIHELDISTIHNPVCIEFSTVLVSTQNTLN